MSGQLEIGVDSLEDKLDSPQNGSINHEHLLRKTPASPGFLVSFLVDARGGAMSGQRHSGVDIIIPPSKVCMPTRLTCRLLKKEKISNLPSLGEEEAFASRVLELGPVGTKFIGLVLIELPHFASKIGQERELVILKSDDGSVWQQHNEPRPSEKVEQTFSTLTREHSEDKKLVAKIYTSYFPKYFVAISKAKQSSKTLDAKSNTIQCSTSHIILPKGAINRETKITLEVLSVTRDQAQEALGVGIETSNIVSIKPLRRKFHQPITVGISVRKELQEKIRNHKRGSQPFPALLLYSISGGNAPAAWEDITTSAPYALDKDTVTFSTTVSARYWLVENNTNIIEQAKALYSEAISVPFYACFYVLAKKHSDTEVQVRILCMNDGDIKQTLEHEENFVHLATSNYVEVSNGKPYNMEISGNMVPFAASPGQLFLIFHSFRVNRLSYMARVQDASRPLACQISIFRNSHARTKQPVCTLDVSLEHLRSSHTAMSPEAEEKWRQAFDKVKESFASQDNINRTPELKLLDIADQLKGDWVALAGRLGITPKEVAKLQTEYGNINEQAILMLHLWVDKMKNQAKASQLEAALKQIGREDIVENCITNSDFKRKSDEPVHPIDDSYHEAILNSSAANGFSEVQEGNVYEVEDVWDGNEWQKTKKIVPTLVEDPIQSSEVEEGESQDLKQLHGQEIEREPCLLRPDIPTLEVTKVEDDVEDEEEEVTAVEETQEVLEDGTVVKVKKIKSVIAHKQDENVA